MAISAENGTPDTLLTKNYGIDFYFLILFWKLVAIFCYLSSPRLPKQRSKVCEVKASPDLLDPHGSRGLL